MKSDTPRRSPPRPKAPPPAAAPASSPPRRPKRVLITAAALLVLAGSTRLPAGEFEWRRDYAAAYYEAGREQKPMLIHVSARWCAPCHRMLGETYADRQVSAVLGDRFVPLMLDADADAEWIERLGIESVPTVLVVNADRRVIHRLSGFQSAEDLRAVMATTSPAVVAAGQVRSRPANDGPVDMTMIKAVRVSP